MENTKNKHLTLEDRTEIQQCLDHGMTFKAIAARTGKDQTTVSKEVKKHLEYTACKVTHRDKHGRELPPPVCPKLLKTPCVCNPCEKKRYSCPYQKQKYIAKLAQKEYETLLAEAREGIPLSKEEFYAADQVITNGIENGQHLCHILQSNNLSMQSSQKPRVEKNHTLFRDVVPKGKSFDFFTQSTVNLIFSHVNSIKRKSLNGKTPFEMFCFTYGEKVAELLGITHIPANQVCQSPLLLKK